MEFGVYLRREQTYPKMLELAQKADELGYYGAFLNDHVMGFDKEGLDPYLEAWTAMTGVGMQTKNLRVGQIVLFNSLRNPAFLAKSIATLDQMTGGRYELLIGAGWNEREYTSYDLMERGRGMPSASERVDRFKEAVEILNLMLSQERTDYEGNYWKLDGAMNIPQPIQSPFRISVGCKGSRMMQITAQLATGINLSGSYIPEVLDLFDKFESIVNKYTEKRVTDYFISGFNTIEITENQERIGEVAKSVAERHETTKEEAIQNLFIGSAEDIIGKILKLEERGMKLLVSSISVDNKLSSDPLSYFKDHIIQSL